MRFVCLLVIPGALLMAGCGKRKQVVTQETRRTTMRDAGLQWNLDDDARFAIHEPAADGMAEPGPSPVAATVVPDDWEPLPTNAFRLLHYRVGTQGEAYVSVSQGGVLENVNRWRAQFGNEPLDTLADAEPVEVAGFKGVWVAAEGKFGGAMGAQAQDNWALRGVVAERDGEILTIKMMGPKVELPDAEQALRKFVAGLQPITH